MVVRNRVAFWGGTGEFGEGQIVGWDEVQSFGEEQGGGVVQRGKQYKMGGGEVYNGKDIYLREKGWRRRWAGGGARCIKRGKGGQLCKYYIIQLGHLYTDTRKQAGVFIHSSIHSFILCLVNLFIHPFIHLFYVL